METRKIQVRTIVGNVEMAMQCSEANGEVDIRLAIEEDGVSVPIPEDEMLDAVTAFAENVSNALFEIVQLGTLQHGSGIIVPADTRQMELFPHAGADKNDGHSTIITG